MVLVNQMQVQSAVRGASWSTRGPAEEWRLWKSEQLALLGADPSYQEGPVRLSASLSSRDNDMPDCFQVMTGRRLGHLRKAEDSWGLE